MTEMVNNTLPPQDGRRYVHNGTEWVLAESEQDQIKKKYFKVAQAAKYAGCTETTIRNAVKAGFLLATRVPSGARNGDAIYISEDDLIEWVAEPKKVRDEKERSKYLSYKAQINEKYRSKKASKPAEEPKKETSFAEPHIDMDITTIAECLMNLIKEKTKEAYKEGYKLGLEDGKLSVQHDKEDTYQKGFREGIKEGRNQAYDELAVYLRESKK